MKILPVFFITSYEFGAHFRNLL